MSKCKICDNSQDNTLHVFTENMFGTGEQFEYLECVQCGCIQLVKVPKDLSIFYPKHYSNFKPVKVLNQNKFSSFIKHKKSEYLLKKNINPIGFLLSKTFDKGFVYKLAPAKIDFNSKILDFGAGNGARLYDLLQRGFTNLHGIDPFIPNNIVITENLSIEKKELSSINEKYDLIMLNHVLEHLPNPAETLSKLSCFLNGNKTILVRIPVAQGYAWHKYKNNWVALDPPRHLFLHTMRSMEIIAKKSGLYIYKVVYDSTEHQFIGSEQLQKGIFQQSSKSYFRNKSNSIFKKKEIKSFKKKAMELNKNNDGDAACFYLKKSVN